MAITMIMTELLLGQGLEIDLQLMDGVTQKLPMAEKPMPAVPLLLDVERRWFQSSVCIQMELQSLNILFT